MRSMEVSEVTSMSQSLPMSMVATTLLLLLCIISLLVLRRCGLNRKNLFAGIPGPRQQHFFGSWINLWELARAKNASSVARNWCAGVEGSLLKIGLGPLDVFVLLAPESIQKIFGSGDSNCLHKPEQLIRLMKPVPWFDGVGFSRGDKWKTRRRLIASKLSYGKLLSYLEPMNESSKVLVTNLEALFEAAGDAHQAIEEPLLHATFRTICKIVFGIESDEEHDDCAHFVERSKRFLDIVLDRCMRPWLAVDFLFRLHPSFKEANDFYTQSRDFIERLVKDHDEETTTRSAGTVRIRKPSVLADFVKAGLPFDTIYEEIVTIMFGGFDTTGKALNYLFLLLALNPRCQEKCRQEVDLVIEEGGCPDDGDFSASDLRKMPYLEMCILETLRIFLPFQVFARQLDAAVTLDENVVLPVGAIVTVVPSAVHMNPSYFPNPERFEPERFSPEGRASRNPFVYIPFSIGPRGCLGTKYAMNEILIMAARVLRRFEVLTDEKLEEIGFVTSITITSERPIKFLFKKRDV